MRIIPIFPEQPLWRDTRCLCRYYIFLQGLDVQTSGRDFHTNLARPISPPNSSSSCCLIFFNVISLSDKYPFISLRELLRPMLSHWCAVPTFNQIELPATTIKGTFTSMSLFCFSTLPIGRRGTTSQRNPHGIYNFARVHLARTDMLLYCHSSYLGRGSMTLQIFNPTLLDISA